MSRHLLALRAALLLLLAPVILTAQQPGPAKPAVADPFGHSTHGDAFNEGPRQSAYLMGGTGRVHLPVTTKSDEAQAFFDQGIGQLHGYWYFESERSFRQVAALDPDCAMAYWGMALSNINNAGRAKGFIQKAVERKARASQREQRWIEAYADFWLGTRDDGARKQDLIRKLEDLTYDFPDELEAKAFLAFHLLEFNGRGALMANRRTYDALLNEILAVEPMHPVHHYRIHVWDGDKAVRALAGAAQCGQSAPNIAHMWHMSGHTFVKLRRYADAAWQQEASARVDHQHMMHDQVLPDQIDNYAHNNQWLVEDYEYIGRAHDAVALAKNLIELPRHPAYNTLGLKDDGTPWGKNHGSSAEGRRRLFETLTRYELWDELIALADTMYLEPTNVPGEQIKRLRALGVAYFSKGDAAGGRRQITVLEEMRLKVRADRIAAAERAEEKARGEKKPADQAAKLMVEAMQKLSDRLSPLDPALAELHVHDALARGDKAKAAELLGQVHDLAKDQLARLWLKAGNADKAVTLARESAAEGESQVYRLAGYVDVLNQAGKLSEAQEQFRKLRPLSAQIDLDVPVMQRLKPVARSLGLAEDWRVPFTLAADVGQRPDLKDLGPVHWQPSGAPAWTLADGQGREVSLADYRGRPVVVIFYLGSDCPHCIEQLNAFEPLVSHFSAAGIALVAISTDSPGGLKKTFEKSRLRSDFTLLSDHTLKTFQAYRAYDDFEKMPLHGTFLIDGGGRVRWQDVGYDPFREPAFLLAEAKRLLGMPGTGTTAVRAR